jgi:hypothetical protein
MVMATHMNDSFVILLLLPLLLFLIAETGVFALPSSYATNSSVGYGIEKLADLSSYRDSGSSYAVTTVSTNTPMAPLPNSSAIVYETESFIAPPTIKTFVIYMANEFHEDWSEESHKHLTNKNAYTIPTNLTISNGTSIAFHMADAPWSAPHDYIVRVINTDTNETALQTPLLGYPKLNRGLSNSGTMVLPIGEYRVEAYLQGTDKVETKPITIKVINTPVNPSSNITAGFFYSPQRPVVNPYDDDGGLHQGHLEYYRQQFPAHGLKIESLYSFHFASCSFYDEEKSSVCIDEGGTPGELYWYDNKTSDNVLIFWSSTKPYSQIATALDEMTWENVYT